MPSIIFKGEGLPENKWVGLILYISCSVVVLHTQFYSKPAAQFVFNAATCFGCKLQPSLGVTNVEDMYRVLCELPNLNGKMFIHVRVIP